MTNGYVAIKDNGQPPQIASGAFKVIGSVLSLSCLKSVITVVIGTSAFLITAGAIFNWFNPVRAECNIAIHFMNMCGEVQNEIRTRVNGQYNTWHDPHNNGTYTFIVSNCSIDCSVISGKIPIKHSYLFMNTD